METPPWVDRSWSDEVPGRLRAAARRWGLRVGDRLASHVSVIVACTDDAGRDLILKLAPPEAHPEREAAALRTWRGLGAARLIGDDPQIGALLLERVVPGTHLPPAADAEAAAHVAATLRRLRVAPADAGAFPSQAVAHEEWLARVRVTAEPGTAGVRLLADAAGSFARLDASTRATVLLHGDLIDKNLLLGPAGYVAVDPIPRIGDPCSDVGFYAAYHPPARGIAVRARAVAVIAGVDPERAARWAAVWAVGEATETWRADSDELQAWVSSREAQELLSR